MTEPVAFPPGLVRRRFHECVKPEVDERGSDDEYRWTCPDCGTQWEYVRSMVRKVERKGLLRQRVARVWYPGSWFCIHRPEVWEPVDVG